MADMVDMVDDMDVPGDLRRELLDAASTAGISYAWLVEIYRRGVNVKLGATGKFPYGKLHADDEGELAVAIVSDRQRGLVHFEFGKLIGSLSLPAAHARQLAALLMAKADEIDKGKM